MRCPFCNDVEDKVIDSRASNDQRVIRRRRECTACGRRYTTYERIEEVPFRVVKKDGTRVPFDRQRILAGMLRACEKRPVSTDALEEITARIESRITEMFDSEVSSRFIGSLVMDELRKADQVAYVRFASVYREFKDINEFLAELKAILQRDQDGTDPTVRRHDGSLTPFRERKIAEAILTALRSSGQEDRALAEELAGVVTLFLEKYQGESVTTLADVEEMVLRVLRETGHAQAARGLATFQEARRRLRDELTVRYLRGDDDAGLHPDGPEEVAPWDRARLVAHLVASREIPESLADEIATSVEQRLIACELRSVTSTLLSELLEHELFHRELDGAADRDRVFGIQRSELLPLLRGDDGENRPPYPVILAKTLAPYALSEIHSEPTARAHGGDRLHVFGLGDPLKVERLALPTALMGEPGGDLLLTCRVLIEALRSHVREEILLPDLVGAVARTEAARRDPETEAQRLLLAVDFRDAYGRGTLPRPHLVVPLGGHEDDAGVAFVRALLETVRAGGDRYESVVVTLAPTAEATAHPELLELGLAMASTRAGTMLRVPRPGSAAVHPESEPQLPCGLQLSLGRIAVNLPLAFLQIDGDTLNDALKELDGIGRLALSAFHERFWYQRSGAAHGLHGVVVRLGGPGKVQVSAVGQEVDLEVWGLAYALEILVRRGIIRPADRPSAAARILGYLDYLLGEEQGGIQLRVRLGGTRDRDVRRRFLDAMRRQAQAMGDPDVLAAVQDDVSDRGTLPVVVPLLSERNAPLLDTPFAERVGPGLALPLAAFGDDAPDALLSRLQSETRLGLLSLAPPREGEDIFEMQEELF